MPDLAEVLAFWLRAGKAAWYKSDPLFDAEISIRFGGLVMAAAETLRTGPHPAENSAEGALSLCILMDQFPRNIFRGLTLSWSMDPLALALARRAVAAGHDQAIDAEIRQFFYTPFMHAEDKAAQAESVALYSAHMGDDTPIHAMTHARIIDKFGRFPPRNPVLGRATTPDERAWLDAGGYGAELRALQG